jgi:hypothetical protein
LGDDEVSSEFRPKIASLQNRISSHSSTRRHSPGAPQLGHGGSPFSNDLESKTTGNTPLLQLVHCHFVIF